MKRTFANLLHSAWDLWWIRTDQILSTLRSLVSLHFQGCPPGHGLRTTGSCRFKARHAGSIQIGSHATLLAAWRSNRVGMCGPVLLTTLGEGTIQIGDHFGASSAVLSSRTSITIGDHVNLGGNVRIFDHDFHSLDPATRRSQDDTKHVRTAPVVLGDDVFVGTNSIILKGVTLGDRCIVGAGAVVTRSFPADSIIAGNPATQIIAKKESNGTAGNPDSKNHPNS